MQINRDLIYKQALIRGIQERFQFTPKVDDLKSVFAPGELKTFLRSVPSSFYDVGDSFENVRSGKFRVNLHVHTNKSDGTMTPLEYLEQSAHYSNKIVSDNLPSYVSAVTDHNNFEASQEIVAMIADEPEKYKNFRFVAGCEFMFLDEDNGFRFPAFEAVGLGINPFSKELLQVLDKFNPINIIKKIKEFGAVLSYAHPIRYCQGNGQTPEFINYLKRIGIDGIESNYQYVGFAKIPEISEQIAESRRIAKENNLFETGGTDTHGKNIFHTSAQKIFDTLI